MARFMVEVTHVGRYTRKAVVEVEADSVHDAVESVDSGEVDAPSFDDPRWSTTYDLRNEEVVPA
jgi:hypothetical protein